MSRLRAMVLACVAVTSEAGRAQSLPPVPSSPPWVTELEYDAEGNVTRTVRGAGTLDLSTRLSYDPLSRVETIVDPSLATTRLQHDGRDRLLQVTDPRRLETRYERDAWGNITKLISPDTGVTEFSYNGAGDLVGSTDSRGVTGRFRHDWRHRPTLVQYSRAGQRDETTRMAYDEEGAAYGFSHGQLTSTSYPGGSSQYRYGPGRELETVTQRIEPGIGANAKTLTLVTEYGYTLARRTSVTYPSGRQLRIAWDGGRIVAMSLTARAGGQEVPLISQLAWEPFGSAVRGWLWHTVAGPVAHERVHDLAGRMVRYPIGDIVRDLRYDEADRIIRSTHLARDGTPRPALDQSFSFDANDRLTGVSTATASWRIDHDANGNRTLLSLNGSASTYATDAASNRLQAVSNPAVSLQYDNAGNATQASGAGRNQTATYNLAGQLAALSMGGKTTAYTYDAAGLRVRKSSSAGGSSTVVFVYDPDGHLLGEYGHDGNALREYVWLEDIPVAMFMPDPANPDGAPQVFHIHTDHLDTPRMVLDANQRTRWRWLAEPFGTTGPETNPDGLGAFTFNLRFPGQYADAESGLFYNQQRYYSPEGGRYTQSDPIGISGGIDTYTYADGNPLQLSDPDGLDPWYRDPPWESHPFFAPNKRREDIARIAEANIRSPNWGKFRANPSWNFIGRFKCNIFVNAMLNQAGAGPGLAPNGNPWLAQDWWDGSVPGFERVPRVFAQRGDIAVQRMRGGHGYTGHVGIVVSPNETVSQSSYTNDVDRSPWGFRPHERDQVMFYRCKCAQ